MASFWAVRGLAAAGAASLLPRRCARQLSPDDPAPGDKSSYPVFRRADVAQRAGKVKGGETWVTFKDGVYDITAFAAAHPGGAGKIALAAGGSVEPFWRIYRQHFVEQAGVEKLLESMRVGTLSAEDYAAELGERSKGASDDPYGDEPDRHPALVVQGATPMNAEVPLELLGDEWLTPNDLWYVRSHHPTPRLDAATFGACAETALGEGTSTLRGLTAAELERKYAKRTVVASMQCAGNRRGGFNDVRQTSGTAWGCGAISTAEWGGAALRDVIAELVSCPRGASVLEKATALGAKHVVFQSVDGMSASVPIEKAVGELGDTLIAYEMNGVPIPRDHGGPLRAITPGFAGVRNVKWLERVVLSTEEAEGPWQRGMNYKAMPPNWTTAADVADVDFSKLPSIYELPTQCVIIAPRSDAHAVESGDESLEVRGWALGSAGRAVNRVDVSADGGATWTAATLEQGADQPFSRAWAWTFWRVELALPEAPAAAQRVQLVAKAVDSAGNGMPNTPKDCWNLRGLNNNSWHRVQIDAQSSE